MSKPFTLSGTTDTRTLSTSEIVVVAVTVLGTYESTAEHKRDTLTCLRAATSRSGTISSAEISEVRWFRVDALPDDLGAVTEDAIRLLR